MLGVELISTHAADAAALGAALLAGVAAGTWRTAADACEQAVQFGDTTRPDDQARARYDPLYERFRRHYPAVRPLFAEATPSR